MWRAVLFYSVGTGETQLEYFVLFWAPHFKNGRDKLEGVQRRRTRMISGTENIPHEERSRELILFSLERRDQCDSSLPVYKASCSPCRWGVEKKVVI